MTHTSDATKRGAAGLRPRPAECVPFAARWSQDRPRPALRDRFASSGARAEPHLPAGDEHRRELPAAPRTGSKPNVNHIPSAAVHGKTSVPDPDKAMCGRVIPRRPAFIARAAVSPRACVLAGIASGGIFSTRNGTRRPSVMPSARNAAADHSMAVYRDRSKYAAENSATALAHRSSASLMAVTKFWPADQSQTSSSTAYPASVSCHVTHSAHARSPPA
jgi:hypothetical protein